MKPEKYIARRTNKENQSISTINTSDRDNANPRLAPPHIAAQQVLYDRDRHTQVKTYTDHGNGHGIRASGTSHYSKVCIIHRI